VKEILLKIPPRYLLVANALLWGGTFYRWIFIEQKPSLGMYPFAIAIPAIAVLCFLALYLMEHPQGTGDKFVGYLLSYLFLFAGALGVFGL
jgi:hypothetical protein